MATGASVLDTKLTEGAGKGAKIGMAVFGVALLVGFIYAGAHLASDLSQVHSSEVMPFVLLGIALLLSVSSRCCPWN
jgi:PiT family inorganic phosphate transporter